MSFDPSTAKPVKTGGFNLSTAKPFKEEQQAIAPKSDKGFLDILGEQIQPTFTQGLAPMLSMSKAAQTVESGLRAAERLIFGTMGAATPSADVQDETFLEAFERQKGVGEVIPKISAFKMPLVKERGEKTNYVDITSDEATAAARGTVDFVADPFMFMGGISKIPKVARSIRTLLKTRKSEKTFKNTEKLLKELYPKIDIPKDAVDKVFSAITPKKVVAPKQLTAPKKKPDDLIDRVNQGEITEDQFLKELTKEGKKTVEQTPKEVVQKQAKPKVKKVDKESLESITKTASKETPLSQMTKKPETNMERMARTLGKGRKVRKPKSTAVQEVQDAIEKLPRLLRKQKSLTSKGSRERVAAMANLSKKYKGEVLAKKRRELLASMGEYDKVDFKSIRKALPQEKVEELFGMIHKSDLQMWQQVTADEGLRKILGAGGGRVPNNSELKLLKEVFGEKFVKTLSEKTPLLESLWEGGMNVLNLPRAIMATADLSAPLRQGMFMITRQKQFAPAFKDMFKYAFSDDAYKGLMKGIEKRPTYQMMDEGGLALTEMGTNLAKREEVFMSNLAERIPGFGRIAKGSNRAYSGFLNKLRADVFDDLIRKADKLGVLDDGLVKDISKYINAATGRGGLGQLEGVAPLLNGALFSPRLVSSRISLAAKVFNPKLYSRVVNGKVARPLAKDAFMRKELLRDWVGFLSTGATVTYLARLAGADVGLDPRSADFGKIKVGNTRYDVWGGFQQYAVLSYRLLSGKTVSSTTGREYELGKEGYKPTTKADILGRGLEFKLSPVASYGWSAFRGTTTIGKKFKHAPEILDRMIPMITQDIYDLAREEGIMGVGMAMPAVFGVGVQNYGERIPVRGKTPSGKPNIKWRFEPTLGETALDAITGTKTTTIPEREQVKLRAEKRTKTQRNIKINTAKNKVKETGRPMQVEDTYIYLEDGIVKTKKNKTTRSRNRRRVR